MAKYKRAHPRTSEETMIINDTAVRLATQIKSVIEFAKKNYHTIDIHDVKDILSQARRRVNSEVIWIP